MRNHVWECWINVVYFYFGESCIQVKGVGSWLRGKEYSCNIVRYCCFDGLVTLAIGLDYGMQVTLQSTWSANSELQDSITVDLHYKIQQPLICTARFSNDWSTLQDSATLDLYRKIQQQLICIKIKIQQQLNGGFWPNPALSRHLSSFNKES